MPAILVISLLDYVQEQNQRLHHLVRTLRAWPAEVTVLFKRRTTSVCLGPNLWAAGTLSVTVGEVDGVRLIAVDPFLNYVGSVAVGLLQGPETAGAALSLARRAFAYFLSVAGSLRDAALAPSFLWALQRDRRTYDVCVAQGPWEAAVAWFLKRMGRIARVVYDDIDYVPGGQLTAFRRWYTAVLERAMLRRADLVISSGWRLGAFRETQIERPVVVIPNGVDPARFTPAHSRTPHPPTLVYIGNIAHYCGVDLAIRALPAIREAVPETRLWLVGHGDGPYLLGLARLVARLNLNHAVNFLGPRLYEQLSDLLRETDVGLATFRPIPLRQYAFPLKVLEYMAAGIPVIGTDDTETADIIRRAECGIVIPFQEWALVHAVVKLLIDREMWTQYAANGKRAVRAYAWEQLMSRELAVIAGMFECTGMPA